MIATDSIPSGTGEVAWEIILLDEVDSWFLELAKGDPETSDLVVDAIDLLADRGPMLGRPLVDRIKGAYRACLPIGGDC